MPELTFTAPSPTGERDGAGDPAHAAAVLTTAGVALDEPRAVRRTLLDTFDGRLHAAGIEVELRATGSSRRLIVTEPGSPLVAVAVSAAPRFAHDLPAGPVRTRLGPILEMRALLPVVSFDSRLTEGTTRSSGGKVVATVAIHAAIEADGGIAVPTTIEVIEAAGHPRPARAIADAIEAAGWTRSGTSIADAVRAAAGIDPRGFTSSPTVPLAAATPAFEAFRAVLANLLDAALANWQGTLERTDPEFLHELRVALRRSRSVLSASRGVIPDDVRERFGSGLRWLAGSTGRARDLDVYDLEWSDYVGGLPDDTIAALQPVLGQIRADRDVAYSELASALRSDRAEELVAAWSVWLHSTQEAGDDPDDAASSTPDASTPAGEVIADRIEKAARRLITNGRAIRPDSPAEALHDLRKDAKRLRYLLECFGGLMETAARKEFVKRLKVLQDNLGELQDTEVHVTELTDAAERLAATAPATTLVAIGQLSQELERRRAAARAAFAELFDEYDSKPTRRALDRLVEGLRS